MSPEVAVMLRPAVEYRRLAQAYPAINPVRALRRPAIAMLVTGVAISLAATGRATAPLVFSTTVCWSFAVVWQLLAAAAIARSPRTPLTFAQRLDLFFISHAPWSLWLLTVAAWSRLFPAHTDLYVLLGTAAAPAAWTSLVVYGFCIGALALPRQSAFWRTVGHQFIVWTFVFVYIAWAIALWPRLQAAS